MPLELTARVMSRDGGHARVNVWQNHGLAGTLVVDAAVADEVAGLINGATKMLTTLQEIFASGGRDGTVHSGDGHAHCRWTAAEVIHEVFPDA